jgi:hypothetical protein
MFKNHFSPVDVCLDRVHGLFDDQLDSDGGSQVEDNVTPVDEFGQERLVFDRIDEIFESRPPLEVGDVLHRTGREVIEHEHVMPVFEQGLRQMRADEAGSARD